MNTHVFIKKLEDKSFFDSGHREEDLLKPFTSLETRSFWHDRQDVPKSGFDFGNPIMTSENEK